MAAVGKEFLEFPPFPEKPVHLKSFESRQHIRFYVSSNSAGQEMDETNTPTIDIQSPGKPVVASVPGKVPEWNEVRDAMELKKQLSAKVLVAKFSDPSDRLKKAAETFENSMKWPPPELKVRARWDEFKKYIGLVSTQAGKLINDTDEDSDPMSDMEESDNDNDEDQDIPVAWSGTPSASFEYTSDSEYKAPKLVETPIQRFLRDPKVIVQEFLSSHMYRRGLLFAEQHLRNAPLIVHYVISWFIGTNVVRDSPGLRDALDVAKKALKELPATMRVSVTISKGWSEAGRACFMERNAAWGAPDTSMDVVEENLQPDVEATRQDDGWGGADWNAGGPSSGNDNWASSSVWGATESNNATWGEISDDWGDPPPLHSVASLRVKQPTYPLSFASAFDKGIVESSWKRITSISPPPSNSLTCLDEVSAWTSQFHRVCLSPWLDVTSDSPKIEQQGVSNWTFLEHGDGYNPYKDDITVLVDSKAAEFMVEGLGIDSRWVELKEKMGEKRSYWFADEVRLVIPSYFVGTLKTAED